MTDNETIALIFDILTGGVLSLLAASLAAHFGYRSADRLPGESRLPHCVFCLRPLQLHEYFPLFGWLLRSQVKKLPCPCGKKTGLWPQPLVEILAFLLGSIAVVLVGWSSNLIPLCLLLGVLPAIALIDLSFGLIPDELNFTMAILGLVYLFVSDGDLFLGLIASAGMLGLGLTLAIGYSKLRGREMLGLGDVKFLAAAGLWIPPLLLPWFLVAAGLIGVLFGLLWRFVDGSKEFPFAPSLCLSLAGCIYYQLFTFVAP